MTEAVSQANLPLAVGRATGFIQVVTESRREDEIATMPGTFNATRTSRYSLAAEVKDHVGRAWAGGHRESDPARRGRLPHRHGVS